MKIPLWRREYIQIFFKDMKAEDLLELARMALEEAEKRMEVRFEKFPHQKTPVVPTHIVLRKKEDTANG